MKKIIILFLIFLICSSTKCTTTSHRCDWTIIDTGYCDPDLGCNYCTLQCIDGYRVAVPYPCYTKEVGDKIYNEINYISE